MKLSRRGYGLVFVLSFALAAPALAQTTGSIAGHVVDENKAPLPGVVVEAKGPALQGSRVGQSDAAGNFRLNVLPPGVYSVAFTLPGSKAAVREGIVVSLGKETTIDQTLRPTLSEQVTVTADAAVVDTTTTALGANFSARTVQALPTARNYTSVVQFVPGVSSDASQNNLSQDTITVYGSSGAENTYLVDGVNTTGVEYGFQGKDLPFEFLEEVEVKTGGYEAEFGKSTGGIVNVITKSGGNTFSGNVFTYYDNDSLQSGAKTTVSTGGTLSGFTKKDYGASLGGFLVKDKLWFFVAYDRVDNTITNSLPAGPLAGSNVDSKSKRDLGAAKLTWRVGNNHTLQGTFLQDPRTDTGAINDGNHSLNGDPSTYDGKQEFGGKDYALRYDGILKPNLILMAQVARHQEKNNVGPASSAGDVIQQQDSNANFFQTGGFGLIQDKTFKRDVWGSTLTWVLGEHEIKGGLELEKETAEVLKRESGGQLVYQDCNPTTSPNPGDCNGPFIYRHSYWTTPDATVDNAPVSALNASPEHKNTGVFLQDKWTLTGDVTLSYGVRWDRQQIIDASGTRQIDLNSDYAPRVGVIWDPSHVHAQKVYGSWGRYYEQLPMDLVIRSFSYERQPLIVNFSPTSVTPDPQAEADLGTTSAILGGFTEPSDPNIKGQYLDEWVAGYEREVGKDIAVGVKGVYRKYGRVIEDFLCEGGDAYCIGNPGEGIMKEISTLDYTQTFPAPKPKRVYKGVQFDVTKRFSDDWQAMASYVWSKLDGNFDGEFSPYTNAGADPNISAAYDYYDFFTNGSDLGTITNHGPLSNDRRHQFKLTGLYVTPVKLQVGVNAFVRSGTPRTRYGYSDIYERYEFFLTPRGAEGRTPWTYEADVHLGYPIAIKKTNLNVMLDIFDILNAQRPVLVDQRWSFAESDNASPTPTNPDYGKAILRTPPRSVRIGVRLSF